MKRVPVEQWSPFGRWCDRNRLTAEDVSERVKALNYRCCAKYASEIMRGKRLVSLKLARVLSQITAGELSMIAIADWRPPAPQEEAGEAA